MFEQYKLLLKKIMSLFGYIILGAVLTERLWHLVKSNHKPQVIYVPEKPVKWKNNN
jgi:hypothetical protein